MRRLPIIAMALVFAMGAFAIGARNVSADTAVRADNSAQSSTGTPAVQVVKISGLLDPILSDFLAKSIRDANQNGSLGVVLQINSTGSVVSDDRIRELARILRTSKVPIVAWVGPSGAVAKGGAAQLLAVVPTVGVAPGSKIGATGEPVVPTSWWTPAFASNADKLRDGTVGAEQAKSMKLAPADMLVLRQALLKVPGFSVKATVNAQGQKVPPTEIRFSQLTTGSSWMHTIASPSVAYLLFVIGLALIIFELFTAGVGIAGLTGAAFFVLGSYGLWVLPVRWWALGVLVFAMAAYVVDIQIGVPRVWTAIASVLFAIGTIGLYQGLATPWLAAVGGIVGMVVFMVYGMPAMTRTRFSTPSIPRDQLVGAHGVTVGVLDPSGVVEIDGAQWPGLVEGDDDAVSLPTATAVEVVAINGVLLRVVARA